MARPRKRKRANGKGTVYRTSDGRYRAEIVIGWVGGRRRRKVRTCRTRKEAYDALDELLARQEQAPDKGLDDFLRGWLAIVKRDRAPSTHLNYSLSVKNWVAPGLGHLKVGELTALEIDQWLSGIENAPTRRAAYLTLSASLGYAVRMGVILSNPCSLLNAPRAKRKEINPFSESEVTSILVETEQHRLHAAFVLAFAFGLRSGELWGLHWADIDFKAETLAVRRQACEVAGRVHLKDLKNAKTARTIHLTGRCLEALYERRKAAVVDLFSADEPVFTTGAGYVLRSNFSNRTWKPLLKRLSIAHRGFHHTRHTAAKMLLADGVPLNEVSFILGHSNPSTTSDVYGEFVPGMAGQATEAVRKRLG